MATKRDTEGAKRAPKGHFVVYVGKELKRFVIPLSCLKNPIFLQLLEKAADEYGFNSNRSIVLPCDELTFLKVTNFLASSS
ncbi:Indole-3-acetic acid-induced protein ARG7 [Morella rubra]|uniref:Indole-3-acetic acid-induced protein ARG7 n=1 Tax=Morella rubra TaxID=262757 RepID=A0A6A1UMA5_9ROSI|nr:Indole-3-acetic acid-induced protein ARG7 [Morella rubra]